MEILVFFICTLSETKLWELDPSKQTSSFAKQTVTLSQSIENFDYIKIVFRKSTADAEEGTVILPTDTVLKSIDSINNAFRCGMGMRMNGSNYSRVIFVESGVYNAIGIDNAIKLNSSGTSNTSAIPLEIIGIKET